MNTLNQQSRFKTSILILVTCCIALMFSSCSKKQSEAIVGKWRVEKDNILVEFTKDGKIKFSEGGQTMNGTYKFSDETHMKAEMTMAIPPEAREKLPPGTPDSMAMTADCVVKINGDEMDIDATMSMPGQETHTDSAHMKRIK